jgi:hypothetical protein
MATAFLEWGGDFVVTPSGSIQIAQGWDQIRQRIIRRIVTNPAQQLPDGNFTPPDYIFHPLYGLGLGSLVDQNFDDSFTKDLEGRITAGVLADSQVDQSFVPTFQYYRPNPGSLVVVVTVVASGVGPGLIQFAVEKPVS